MASDRNYSTTAACATVSYPGTAQVDCGFDGMVTLVHLGTSNNITFSFDGTNDAGVLVPGVVQGFKADARSNRYVWLKGAAVTSTSVLVVAEGTNSFR